MFLTKKGQSTAEYAIVFALVVAVAAGVLQVALKGGIRQKNKQALNYLLTAGDTTTAFNSTADQSVDLFSQDWRQTTIDTSGFKDERVMLKGGAEKRIQNQTTASESVSVELINAIDQ